MSKHSIAKPTMPAGKARAEEEAEQPNKKGLT
jgi:hypothetical protein